MGIQKLLRAFLKGGYKLGFEYPFYVYGYGRRKLKFYCDPYEFYEGTWKVKVMEVHHDLEQMKRIKNIENEEARFVEIKRYETAFELVKQHWLSVGCEKVRVWPDDDKDAPKSLKQSGFQKP